MTTKKHGHASKRGSPEYVAWSNMKNRCNCKTSPVYNYYGGRGIKVCREWQESFQQFLDDMGPRPSPTDTLDRIDPNGDYEPKNCRWADRVIQQRNRRDSVYVTAHGITLSLNEWANITGINPKTIYGRIYTCGWSHEKAVTTNVQQK